MINCNPGNAQIKLLPDGKIGIGTTTPTKDVEFRIGNIMKIGFIPFQYPPSSLIIDRQYADTRFYPEISHKGFLGLTTNFWYYIYADKLWYVNPPAQYSDIKFKKNVSDLENSLEKILSLKGVKYDLDLAAFGNTGPKPENTRKEYGLIAQDVLNVIPDIVEKDSLGYAINYTSLIPVLIEALKEQQRQIEELELNVKMNAGSEKSGLAPAAANTGSYLAQNRPNPFTENTIIEYTLTPEVKDAAIYIYDLQGKQIKSFKLPDAEFGSVTVNGSELQPGIYHYSLITDGEVVGIEKMILTQ